MDSYPAPSDHDTNNHLVFTVVADMIMPKRGNLMGQCHADVPVGCAHMDSYPTAPSNHNTNNHVEITNLCNICLS